MLFDRRHLVILIRKLSERHMTESYVQKDISDLFYVSTLPFICCFYLIPQEEFVKWKGSLFFRFMVALVDPVPAIAR